MCDGGSIGDIFELEEGLPCFDSLTFVYKYLGDDPRDLGANLGIKLASDDGGVTVVGGEVASGEGAYGEFLGALGLSLLAGRSVIPAVRSRRLRHETVRYRCVMILVGLYC